jgi:hypothetical protein
VSAAEVLKAAFDAQATQATDDRSDERSRSRARARRATDADQTIADTIPQSLLFTPAYDHPKAAGYKAITSAVLDGLSRVGALAGPSAGVSGVTAAALGPLMWSAGNTTDPLGSSTNNVQDRSGTAIAQAPDTSSAPTVVTVNGRRVWRFDGVDDRLWAFVGTLPQPFTVIAQLTVRDFQSQAVGVFWTYDTPGATLSISTSGRVVLDAGTSLQTGIGQVTVGVPATVAAVANGASSSVGVIGALTTGDAGTRSIVTQGQIGRYSVGATNYPSAIDLDTIFVAPWAMTEAQINAMAAQIDLATPLSMCGGGTGATTLTGLVKGNGTSPMTAAAAGTDYVAPVGAQGSSIQLYNTTDQVTNYERVSLKWASNIARLISENGGTGAKRTVSMESYGFIRAYGSAQDPTIGTIQLSINTSSPGGTIAGINGTLNAGSNGASQVGLSISPTISQDVTKPVGYTAALINVTETTAGTDAKKLIDAQVGSTSKFTVDNTGKVTLSGTTATISSGTGTPEGAVIAPVGSMYTRTDGGAGTTLYIKKVGAGNTGWAAK